MPAPGLRQKIPPAWSRVKHGIITALDAMEISLVRYRTSPISTNWEDFLNATVATYAKLRMKVNIAEKNKNKKGAYDKLKDLRKYYFSVKTVQVTKENLETWRDYFELLQDLAEQTGITKVSVEDTDPDEAYAEGYK